MTWISRLLSSAPGTPATHSFVILVGTLTVSIIALYRIDDIDIGTYTTCIAGLATAAGGATWASAQAAKIESKTPPTTKAE